MKYVFNIFIEYPLCFCFRESSALEFYDANNFRRTVLTYSMAFRNPGVICTAASSILLYEDKANSPREVHWLDCRTSPPKPSGRYERYAHQRGPYLEHVLCAERRETFADNDRYRGDLRLRCEIKQPRVERYEQVARKFAKDEPAECHKRPQGSRVHIRQ